MKESILTKIGALKAFNRLGLLKRFCLKKCSFSEMPVELIIESTNRCNMECIMCPRGSIKPPFRDLRIELFKKIVDETKEYVELIDFSFRGEPLLNGNIFEMINYAKSKNIKTYLQTNASLLDEKRGVSLLKSGIDMLTISIDAATPSTYANIRRGCNFNSIVENTECFIDLKKRIKNHIFLMLQIIPMQQNLLEIEEFRRHWEKHKLVFIREKKLSTRAGLVAIPSSAGSLGLKKSQKERCFRIWRSLVVYSDGNVVPCCNDFSSSCVLGDSNTQTIRDIWGGEKMVELRKKHIMRRFNQIPLCMNCEFPLINLHKQSAAFIFNSHALHKLATLIKP